jgi:uncharacterized protein (DUF1800 family)
MALTSHGTRRLNRHMRLSFLFALLGVATPALQAQALSPRDSALHALSRLAYGPRPGDVERVAAMGVQRWIEAQLAPERLADARTEAATARFAVLKTDATELAQRFVAAQRERARRQREQGVPPTDSMMMMRGTGPFAELRRLGGEVQQLAVVRATLSERQLYEVMVDFWTNHFNVFFAKGAVRYLLPSYIEHTIRPRALGRFEDLLIATAQSPAMLFYLDNVQSVTPGSRPPQMDRLDRFRGRPRADSMRALLEQRMPRGINENYARELLELHTLGVDGGYTQQDVQQVARVLTGWGMQRPGMGAAFEFHDWAHDNGEKTVLGVRFRGNGMQEGVDLLKMLARHHATMHFVSAKLCARFVADDPPDGCIDAAVDAWHASDGDIRAVLHAIFRSPDFWSPRALRGKVKTPLEFVVSAARAVGAAPDTTLLLAQVVTRLGQPLYLQAAPTGYPETQADWVNSGALLQRMNVAVGLAAGRLPGVTVNLDAVLPTGDERAVIAAVNERLLGGTMSEQTRVVLQRELADVRDPVQMRAYAVGLALGGPEFQRQ